jgi:hypothetical protein
MQQQHPFNTGSGPGRAVLLILFFIILIILKKLYGITHFYPPSLYHPSEQPPFRQQAEALIRISMPLSGIFADGGTVAS